MWNRRCPPNQRPVGNPPRCVPVNPLARTPGQHSVGAVFASPMGGPTSTPSGGLYPFSNSAGPLGPVPQPQPAPPRPCLPTIFTECFAACVGVVPPQVVCGWSDGGASAGTGTFTPGQVAIDGLPMSVIRLRKTIPNPVTVFNITGQYNFQEFPSLTANDFYDFSFTDAAGVNALDLFLDGSGFVYFQVGPSVLSPYYYGVWTPNMGSHVVHYTVTAGGVPALWIDGVSIPLVLQGSQVTFANAPANDINGEFGRNAPGGPALVTRYFLTAGNLPPTMQFCCA